jgi:hypothetical protein
MLIDKITEGAIDKKHEIMRRSKKHAQQARIARLFLHAPPMRVQITRMQRKVNIW